ncbi:MAG TPA: hypothetical protein VE978_23095 [Chitinophagales bacterium]|nr:hypothetical protein [Chitinophagales bacterium]
MERSFLTILFAMVSMSFTGKKTDKLYLNYRQALIHACTSSTFSYFLVVTAKDMNTEKSVEVCTRADWLLGALHLEYDLSYDSVSEAKILNIALNNKKRYFQFRNEQAINNLSIYPLNELRNLELKVNFDSLATEIKKHKKYEIRTFFESPNIEFDEEFRMYAHELFNREILTGENDCFGGTLIYIWTGR